MAWEKSKIPKHGPKPKAMPVMPAAVKHLLEEAPGGGMDSRELLTELIRTWGGASELATDIRNEFREATPGGMTRQRILEMIQRLIINNTSHNLTAVRRPEDMTQDDLLETANRYFLKMSDYEKAHPAPPQDDDDGCEPADD